jgi:hypothetical protein
MALLQTCGYVVEQMQTEVNVDINKFLEAFSIEGDSGRIQPPLWNKSEGNSVVILPSSPTFHTPPQEGSSTTPVPFNMSDYRHCRQVEALCWIDLQEKRSSIIARFQPTSAEDYQKLREAVTSDSGRLRQKPKKTSGSKFVYINSHSYIDDL